ncbi:hypothetical protein [Emticicia sp. TH156]|uniref:hypothetical protein n=1 Tax=Emticicia sp. TH156 TaxID=2067454 RepID=UPI000C75A9AA|nr:hypothetical protein [Emticicia sp. TH156]PLK45059.1 hypothetical protein C0V77_07420 [Emticicia sp. TH156]
MTYNKAYRIKLIEVIFLLLVVTGLLQYIDVVAQWQTAVLTNSRLLWFSVGGILLLSIFLSAIWQYFDKKVNLHEWFQTIIIFFVAHQIANFGVSKIMQIQFQLPQSVLERPVGELNGYWMTWTYFGYSPTFTIILGSLQIVGSVLLLFKKTRLLATFILLPMMINVCFMEHFYQISPLAYFNALHYTAVLFFILLQYYEGLLHLLFSYKEYFYFDKKTLLLSLARLIVIGGAFWHIFWLKKNDRQAKELIGVWQVDAITMQNRSVIPENGTEGNVWSRIYFEQNNSCLFKFDSEKFNDSKDWYGHYETEPKQRRATIVFRRNNQADSLKLSYQVSGNHLTLSGVYQRAPLVMKLSRLK